jgi:hypothetical protein
LPVYGPFVPSVYQTVSHSSNETAWTGAIGDVDSVGGGNAYSRPWLDGSQLSPAQAAGDFYPVVTRLMRLTGFGFSVPADEAVTDITVRVRLRQESPRASGTSNSEHTVRLTVGGLNTSPGAALPNSWETRAYGGSPLTYWGATVAPAQLNDSSFGVELAYVGVGGPSPNPSPDYDPPLAEIDYVEIEVTTVVVPDPPAGRARGMSIGGPLKVFGNPSFKVNRFGT